MFSHVLTSTFTIAVLYEESIAELIWFFGCCFVGCCFVGYCWSKHDILLYFIIEEASNDKLTRVVILVCSDTKKEILVITQVFHISDFKVGDPIAAETSTDAKYKYDL